VLKLPVPVSLVKKDGLPEIAHKIVEDLKWDFNVGYDEKDGVGRRYRRQDALNSILYYCGSSNNRRSNSNDSSS
jgi:glycyl-tRNA synthetase (class II)